jgi:hypothetical protein
MEKHKEFWIYEDHNSLLDVCRYKLDNTGEQEFHVIEKSAFDELQEDLALEKERTRELVEALKFYAEENNWMITREDNLHTAKRTIIADIDSYGVAEQPGLASKLLIVGGALARKTLAEIESEEK